MTMRRLTTLTAPVLTLHARTDGGLVIAMRATQWNAPDAKRDYMMQVADRVAAIFGAPIRTTNASDFLADLARAELVRVETIVPE
jgi:hypothetical protein